jgi:chromosome segregation ATPase
MNEMQRARTTDMIAAEINALTAQMLSSVIEIGRRMVEAKEMLPYGTFGKWIEDNTGYSSSTANNFMRLFKEYGAAQGSLFGAQVESQTIGKLSYSKALALLALPADERETFAEEYHVDEMSTKELKQAIRERDEAKQQAEDAKNRAEEAVKAANLGREQAETETALAQRERDKMAEGMKLLDARIGDLKAKIEDLTKEAERRETELETLKAKPVDVAVEKVVDQEAIETARKEAVTRMEKKVAEAKAAKEQAEAQRAAMEEELAAARTKLDAAEKQVKEAFASSNQEIATFKLLFDQAQETVNKMSGLVLKLEQAGRNEEAGKLRRALKALAGAVEQAGGAK